MSQLRTAKKGDLGAFPGSTFVVDDTPPIAQCQETEIAGAAGITDGGTTRFIDPNAFAGIDLAGKILTITAPPANVGDYTIASNDDTIQTLTTEVPLESEANVYTVHDPGQAYLTRNQPSFQRFTENLGKAHTTKGGQLFVDVAAGPMADACTDAFDPQ